MKSKARFTNKKYISISVVEILRLSLPISINRSSGQIAITLLIAVLGLRKTEDLASFSLAISLMAVLFSFACIISVGVQNLSAQCSKDDINNLRSILRSGVIISLATGIILLLLSWSGVNPFEIVAGSGNLSQNSYDVFLIISTSLPITSTAACLGFYLEGTGRAKVVSLVALTTSLIKVILAYLLIYGSYLGDILSDAGRVAVAIVFSDLVALIMFFIYISKKDEVLSHDTFLFRKNNAKEIKLLLNIGTPSALGFCLQKLGFSIISFIAASLGESEIAAYTIMFNIVTLSAIPLSGVAHANSILASKSIGDSDEGATGRYYSSSLKIAAVYTSIFAVIYIISSNKMAALFTADLNVLNIIESSVLATIILFISHSFFSIPIAYLRSFSDTLKPQAIMFFIIYAIAAPCISLYSSLFISPSVSTIIFILGGALFLAFLILHLRSSFMHNSHFSFKMTNY